MTEIVAVVEVAGRRTEVVIEGLGIVVTEVGEVLTDDLGGRRGLLDDLARYAPELVVAPVRFDVTHRPACRGRAALRDEAGGVSSERRELGLELGCRESAAHEADC